MKKEDTNCKPIETVVTTNADQLHALAYTLAGYSCVFRVSYRNETPTGTREAEHTSWEVLDVHPFSMARAHTKAKNRQLAVTEWFYKVQSKYGKGDSSNGLWTLYLVDDLGQQATKWMRMFERTVNMVDVLRNWQPGTDLQ